MGLFDHLRTWEFETSASPEACVDAFTAGLTKGGPQLLGSRWSVSRSMAADGGLHAVGSYEGRRGVAGVATAFSTRATNEQEAAIGSTLALQVSGAASGGRVRATMAMTRTAKVFLFFTADARFFRSAMNRVARTMRATDPTLYVAKH